MKRVKKQRLGTYSRHLTMRFRFKAVADKRQWPSAASIPRLNRRLMDRPQHRAPSMNWSR